MKNLFKDPTFQVIGTAMVLIMGGSLLTMRMSSQLHYVIIEDDQPRVVTELRLKDVASDAKIFKVHFDGFTSTKVYSMSRTGEWEPVPVEAQINGQHNDPIAN